MDSDLLSAYLPLDRRRALAAGRLLPGRAQGATLLTDIVGFTPLTDALVFTLGPRRGAEELTRLLNAVYDALIVLVHRHGGSVVAFSGDGFLSWFDGDSGLRAVACGRAMQQAIRESYSTILLAVPAPPGGRAALSIKAAVAAGPVRRFLVGDPQVQRLDVLAGATLDRLAQAEQVARQGEVVVGPAAARQLGDLLTVAEWREGFGVVGDLAGDTSVDFPPLPLALTAEQVRPFLLPPVYERLVAGQGEFLAELRPAVVLFMCFGGLDYDGDDASDRKLDAYVRWVQVVLRDYGGYLLQLITGDKGSYLYAAFGALTAHEDDAERALTAATELQRLPPELDFIREVRIGVSQGRIRVGAYGGRTRRTYGALGDEVNVAARLMGTAPPGEIRCSQRVYQTAGGRWAFEALPAVQLKGKPEPLPAYRPLRRRGVKGPVAGALVGRRAEVETLARLLAKVRAGQRQVLLLEGEAGIGKSRLVGELAELAREGGVAWLGGAGQSVEQRTPYRAWRDVLAGYFALDEGMDREEQQRRVRERVVAAAGPALVERIALLNDILRLDLPETELTRSLEPQLRHESLVTLVIELLRDAAAAVPLVLVLEDAQWLDSLSWELALSMVRALPDLPLFLVLVLRPLEEPRRAEYVALTELKGVEILRLEAMPRQETAALAAARLGLPPEALPGEVAELVREWAGGNPFFAEELAHVLRDSGAVVVEEGACTVTGDLTTLREHMPDTVEGVVLARIDRLPPEEQLTLKVASVIGRSFLYRTLQDVHPRRVLKDLLRAHLDDLARRDLALLEALEPELIYLFKHIITQQVAYDTLLFAQRRELHRTVAGWYERVYADNLEPYQPLLVHHWNRAEDAARERHYAALAGKQAAAQFANAEAIEYFSRALDLTPAEDIAERYTLLLAREKVYDLQGAREAQSQDLATLEALAEALGSARRQAEVALRRAKYAEVTGDYAAAMAATSTAIDLAQEAQALDLEAAGHMEWGVGLFRQGEYAASRHKLERCLVLARLAGLHQVEADGLRNIGNTYFLQGDFARAKDYYEQTLALCRRIGDQVGEGRTLNCLGIVSVNQGDFAEAAAYLEQALLICRRIGDLGSEGIVLDNLGDAALARGDYVQARTLYQQSLGIRREIGDQVGEGIALANLGIALRFLGDYARAKTYAGQGVAVFRAVGERWGEGQALAYLGLLTHLLGDDQAARQQCREALQIAQELGIRDLEPLAWTILGHSLTHLGHLEEATAAYRRALDLRREAGEPHLTMEVLAGLVRVALLQGDVAQAQAQAEEILRHLETGTLDGTEEPFRIYLTCYRALQANQDPRAEGILRTAHGLLQAQAGRIEDEATCRAFLENVTAHREIMAGYRALWAAGENN